MWYAGWEIRVGLPLRDSWFPVKQTVDGFRMEVISVGNFHPACQAIPVTWTKWRYCLYSHILQQRRWHTS